MSAITNGLRAAVLPIRYLLAFWLFILSAVSYLDRTNISIAGIEIGSQFRIDNVHLGWVFSAFLIGYALFQIPGGLLAIHFGPRQVVTFGVMWWGVFTALTAVVPAGMRGALLVLILVRFALGAGEAVVYPASNQFVAQWIPVNERGKANGLIFAGVGAGAGLTPLLLTAIIVRYGWRSSFWFSAAVGMIARAVWYWAARDTPEEHPFVRLKELARIREGLWDSSKADSPENNELIGSHGVPWARIFTSKEIFGLTVSYFAFGYVAWIYFAWFYIYLAQARGLNLKMSAIYSMFPFLAMMGCSLLGGVASDWMVRRYNLRIGRCGFGMVSLGLTAMLLLLGARAHDARITALILAGGAGLLYLSQSCFWCVTADIAGRHAGVVSGMMNMGAQVGGAVTASMTPLIAARFGWEASFTTAGRTGDAGRIRLAAGRPPAEIVVAPRSSFAKLRLSSFRLSRRLNSSRKTGRSAT